jgi:acyl dehydratase
MHETPDAAAPESSAGGYGAPASGMYYEQLTVGTVIKHAVTRTLLDSDNILFSTMTMNPARVHVDFDYSARETEFGRPLVNSLLTLGVVVGISVYEATLGTTVANLGFQEIAFPTPVFGGDTIRVETEVLAARESRSRPTQGIVTFEHRGFNQRGEMICRARRDALMLKASTA